MRVVAGEYGGRRLNAVPGRKTRPTTDKVKEALFSSIGPYFAGGSSLDLFAGSGGLSIEAVSRGIDHAVMVDRQYAAVQVIKKNVAVTKHPEKFTVIKNNANRAIKALAKQEAGFDLVFLDPPYAKQQIVKNMTTLATAQLLNPNALVVAETNQEADLPANISGFDFLRQHHYGITVVTIYRFPGKEQHK